mmetsp:Transcript_9280/g.11128  ORF Transcript_9280/g.11128 Transcript_9280/m.11128 type:complete len:244 (-) Transcript_9280:237-968(-)
MVQSTMFIKAKCRKFIETNHPNKSGFSVTLDIVWSKKRVKPRQVPRLSVICPARAEGMRDTIPQTYKHSTGEARKAAGCCATRNKLFPRTGMIGNQSKEKIATTTTVPLPTHTNELSEESGYHSFQIFMENRVAEELKTLAKDDIKDASILATIIPRRLIGTTVLIRKGYDLSKSKVSASAPAKLFSSMSTLAETPGKTIKKKGRVFSDAAKMVPNWPWTMFFAAIARCTITWSTPQYQGATE